MSDRGACVSVVVLPGLLLWVCECVRGPASVWPDSHITLHDYRLNEGTTLGFGAQGSLPYPPSPPFSPIPTDLTSIFIFFIPFRYLSARLRGLRRIRQAIFFPQRQISPCPSASPSSESRSFSVRRPSSLPRQLLLLLPWCCQRPSCLQRQEQWRSNAVWRCMCRLSWPPAMCPWHWQRPRIMASVPSERTPSPSAHPASCITPTPQYCCAEQVGAHTHDTHMTGRRDSFVCVCVCVSMCGPISHSCPDGFEFKLGIQLPPVLGVGPAEETCIRCDKLPSSTTAPGAPSSGSTTSPSAASIAAAATAAATCAESRHTEMRVAALSLDGSLSASDGPGGGRGGARGFMSIAVLSGFPQCALAGSRSLNS